MTWARPGRLAAAAAKSFGASEPAPPIHLRRVSRHRQPQLAKLRLRHPPLCSALACRAASSTSPARLLQHRAQVLPCARVLAAFTCVEVRAQRCTVLQMPREEDLAQPGWHGPGRGSRLSHSLTGAVHERLAQGETPLQRRGLRCLGPDHNQRNDCSARDGDIACSSKA